MILRRCWQVGWLLCLGCHSLVPLELDSNRAGTAQQLWEQGQKAMRQGQPAQAVAFYEQSLAVDGTYAQNHISLAAAFLESGAETDACNHLAHYLAAHPDHVRVRAHYAELLWRQQRPREAREQFERFLADAQDLGEDMLRSLIQGHSRLMEMAEAAEDDYELHLHRGIGLYWLARRLEGVKAADSDLSSEGLLCKAAGDLALARSLRPEEARPCWYLYTVWQRLAQQQQALRWLDAAEAAAPFSYLTPAEQRSLALAGRCQEKSR